MLAKATQAVAPTGSGVSEFAKRMATAADQRDQRPDLQPQPDQHNFVTNALASGARMLPQSIAPAALVGAGIAALPARSEERSVGKKGVRQCRSRWSPYH